MSKVLIAVGILSDILYFIYTHLLGVSAGPLFLIPLLCVFIILLTAIIHLFYLAEDVPTPEELCAAYATTLPKLGLRIPYNVIIWFLVIINILTWPMSYQLGICTTFMTIFIFILAKNVNSRC